MTSPLVRSSRRFTCVALLLMIGTAGCKPPSPAATPQTAPTSSTLSAAAAPVPLPAEEAFPPIDWKVPSGAAAPAESLPTVLSYPLKDMDKFGIPAFQHLPGSRGEFVASRNNQIVRGRIDLQTGELSEIGILEHVDQSNSRLWGDFNMPPSLDVDSEGRLALFTPPKDLINILPNTEGTICIWPAGQAGSPLPLAIPCRYDGWIGWAAAGRLLVLSGGKLAAWDVTSGKRVLEFPGTYTQAAAMAPSRKWVVVGVGDKYLEVLDATSGECLGRLPAKGQFTCLTVAQDGQRLAGFRWAKLGELAEVHVWDLRSGKFQMAIPVTSFQSNLLLWAGTDQLALLQSSIATLIDLQSQSVAGRLRFPHNSDKDNGPQAMSASPDGRLWWTYRGRIFTAAMPVTSPAAADLVPGTTVAIEASTGDAARDQRALADLSAAVKSNGFQVGDSKWKIRLTAKIVDSASELEFSAKNRVKIPVVSAPIEIIAPDGAVVAQVGTGGSFGYVRSRYFTKTKRPEAEVTYEGRIIKIDYFDFQGKDPRTAMIEESWDNFFVNLAKVQLPRSARQVAGKFTVEAGNIPLTPPAEVAELIKPG